MSAKHGQGAAGLLLCMRLQVGTYRLSPELKKRAEARRQKHDAQEEEEKRKRQEAAVARKQNKAEEEKVWGVGLHVLE